MINQSQKKYLPSKQEILKELQECIVNFKMDEIKKVANIAIKSGIEPYDAVIQGLSKGMEIVSKFYETGEFFLSDLIMAGETMKAAMEILEPHLKASTKEKAEGVVVIGTVEGDMHDIGKNIIATVLSSAGFRVIDIGVDAKAESFLSAVRDNKANILAISGLLTTTMPNMKEIIQLLEEEGLRKTIKIIVGGAPISEEFAQEIKADAYGKGAIEAMRICKKWVQEKPSTIKS